MFRTQWRIRIKLLGRGAVTAFLLAGAVVHAAEAAAPREAAEPPARRDDRNEMMARFTINLTRFVTWPESAFADAQAPFVIATYPLDPMFDRLVAAAKNETVEGRPIEIIRAQSVDDLLRSQLVFISRSYAARPDVLRRLGCKPILTVSDYEQFIRLGGVVQFDLADKTIVPRVSIENLKAAGLEARAQLLRLATNE
jgi:hypothetical protein